MKLIYQNTTMQIYLGQWAITPSNQKPIGLKRWVRTVDSLSSQSIERIELHYTLFRVNCVGGNRPVSFSYNQVA